MTGGRGRRALVAGWFSFPDMGATAGDLMALEVAGRWLTDAGIPWDAALDPPFEGGLDWRQVDARRYTDLLFVCGPFYARRRLMRVLPRPAASVLIRLAPVAARLRVDAIDRIWTELLLRRFGHARLIGLDLSMLGPASVWHPFHTVIQRDGAGGPTRPDIALAHRGPGVPVVGKILVERQREYGAGAHDAADRAIEQALSRRSAAVVAIDTRLDRPNPGGLRTPAEVEALVARMDVVVTTRMHGAVLALKNGVPAAVVDPIPGGAKVRRQMEVLGWPHVLGVDELQEHSVDALIDACLRTEARERAAAIGRQGAVSAEAIRDELYAALGIR